MKKVYIVVELNYDVLSNREEHADNRYLSQNEIYQWCITDKFNAAWHFLNMEQAEKALENYEHNQYIINYFTIMPLYIK